MSPVGPVTESVHPAVPSAAIVELRQYTLRPGQREALIDLFDREFVETQEAVGMTVIGQFRDLDRPDTFVWLRGFSDMRARAASLTAFYDGAIWRAHGSTYSHEPARSPPKCVTMSAGLAPHERILSSAEFSAPR